MKIKENGNEIPIRKSITDLVPQGLYNPISVSKDINDKAYIKFDENFLKENVKSSTLSITQNGDKSINIDGGGSSLSAGDGLVSDGNTINIDAKKFERDITIGGNYTKWDVSSYLKVNLNDTAVEEIESTKINIYSLTDPLYSFSAEIINETFKENIDKTIPKITIVKYNRLYFYPVSRLGSNVMIWISGSMIDKKLSVVWMVTQNGSKPVFYNAPTTFSKISDPTTL